MAGAAVIIDVTGLGAIRHIADRLEKVGGFSPRALLAAIGGVGESQTRRRLMDEKTAPDGTPWKEWSEEYAKRRPPKGGILDLSGLLIDTIGFVVGGDSVEVGTPMIYGATHQFGAEERGIPARPYLGVSADNEDELLAATGDFFDNLLRKNLSGAVS